MDAKSILRILFNIPLFFLTLFLALTVSLDSTMQISISFGFESDTLYYNLFWILYWIRASDTQKTWVHLWNTFIGGDSCC